MQNLSIPGTITALMPSWAAEHITHIHYLSGGYSNDNYAFDYNDQRYVLRVPRVPQPYVDRLHEQTWYRNLPPDIGVRPTAFDAATGHMISPWLDGKLLADAWADLHSNDLVSYLAALHNKLPDESRHYDLVDINQAYWLDEPSPYEVKRPSQQTLRTCHNDLNPWNILITDSGWVTLDWEFVGTNDPLFDLVALHQGLELPSEDLAVFASAYLDNTEGNVEHRDLEERLFNVRRSFWIREHGWAQFQLSKGNNRTEIKAQAESAKARLRWLD